MSQQRSIRRRSERQNWALDVMDARGVPNASTPALALAGNTGSGLRKKAAREAFRRAKRYFELTGKVVVPTREQVLAVALQLVGAVKGQGLKLPDGVNGDH